MRPASRQRGSIAVLAAIFLSVAVILLASIDIGYLFFQKRELQKTADLAALAGAQQLARSDLLPNDRCGSAYRVAADNARVGQSFTGATDVSCGKWDPATGPAPTFYSAYAGGVTPTGQTAPNAIRVQAAQTFNSFFGAWSSQQVVAAAIATADAPIAVFSVGSRLLQINNGAVPSLLTALGVNISGTSLLSYNGLANVSATPSGLLNALGFQIPLSADVGTIKQAVLVNTGGCSNGSCTLEAVLGAISVVGGQQNLVSALGLQTSQLDLQVKMLSDATGRGLFTLLDTADGRSALQANVNALDLLTTAIGVANGQHFGNLSLGASIPAIASSTVQAGIVEPPSIGIGGIGATAYTAQVRLFGEIRTSAPTAGLLSVDLPLAIDVVDGQGVITAMCTVKDSNGNDTATIAVSAGILKACVGDINANTAFSTQGSCDVNLRDKQLVNILNGQLALSSHVAINALTSSGSVTLSKGQTATVGNNLQIGATVGDLLQAILATLLGKLLDQGQGRVTSNSLASVLLNASGAALNTTLTQLNATLSSLNNFINGLSLSAENLLGNSLSSTLAAVGSLLPALLNSISTLLQHLVGNAVCLLSPLGYNQCVVQNQLNGNQGSGANAVSNVLLSLLGLVQTLLTPVLNSLGDALTTLLSNLLGLQLGQVDVKLIDLNCGGGPHVRLVH